jgi:hypothetical protein
METLLRRRVRTGIEAVAVERRGEQLELRAPGGGLRLRDAPEDARTDEPCQESKHQDHDEELD